MNRPKLRPSLNRPSRNRTTSKKRLSVSRSSSKLVPIKKATHKKSDKSEKSFKEKKKDKKDEATDELLLLNSESWASTESQSSTDSGGGGKDELQLAWMRSVLDLGVDGLLDEYKTIVSADQLQPHDTFLKFPSKNRYPAVKCWEETRVAVKRCEGTYIHANYVSGRSLILTQGPLKESLVDFWHTVWQEKSAVICMLCETKEEGRTKCEEYWKDEEDGVLELAPFTIKTKTRKAATGSFDGQEVIVSELWLVKDEKEDKGRKVAHFHYTTWPDRFVPSSELFIPSLQLKIMNIQARFAKDNKVDGGPVPMLIHCSAGVGRSGTFAAIFVASRLLMVRPEGFKVGDLLGKLRRERGGAVQNATQYVYLHLVLLADLARIHTLAAQAPTADILKFKVDFNDKCKPKATPTAA